MEELDQRRGSLTSERKGRRASHIRARLTLGETDRGHLYCLTRRVTERSTDDAVTRLDPLEESVGHESDPGGRKQPRAARHPGQGVERPLETPGVP